MVTKGGLGDILQIVAYENGFAALNTTGQVWTWGSEQCLPCLGRDTDDAQYVELTLSIEEKAKLTGF